MSTPITIITKIGSGILAVSKDAVEIPQKSPILWEFLVKLSPSVAHDTLTILRDLIVAVADSEGAAASDGLNFRLDAQAFSDICKLVSDARQGSKDAASLIQHLHLQDHIAQGQAKPHLAQHGLVIHGTFQES